ncbi:MAG: calcium:proton antiporter [Burkholderiales bacterium]
MLRKEWPLAVSLITTALFYAFGGRWFADLSSVPWLAFLFAWLFGVILLSAIAVLRHAELLAARLGEPLGTLVLTLAVTGMEVMMIAAVMYTGKGNATFARDAMFAVVMIVMNGMIGLALVLGGLRHHEQTYNLQGANAFLAVIVPITVLCLVLPNFTVTTPGPTLSGPQALFLVIMSVALYGVFLTIQNLRHRDYFIAPGASGKRHSHVEGFRSSPFHGSLLIAHLLPVVLLAKQLAVPINHGIHALQAPAALGGLLVSTLVLLPESVGAVRAALANELQRSVNLLLGSVVATISLTIPAVLVIGFVTGQEVVLGLLPTDMVLLVLTLAVSTLTFASARTNVLLGAVHLLLFLAYLMLLYDR